MNQDIDQVVQTAVGEVQVRFNSTQSLRLTNIATSSRRSVSRPVSIRGSVSKQMFKESIPDSNIPHPIYERR